MKGHDARKQRRRERQKPELNLTSLIDILFIVLLFLLLSTTFREVTFMRVDLPESETGQRVSTQVLGPVMVSIDENGQVFLDESRISLDSLIDRLRQRMNVEDTEIILAADRRLDYGHVIEIMDRLRRAGYFALSLQTLSEQPASD